jgi:hypothetical protein
MSKLGVADLGIATLNDMRENAGMIASLDRKIPLIADADTGYGGKIYHANLQSSAHNSRTYNGWSNNGAIYASRRCCFPPRRSGRE